ncbi:MAG: VanZ family protein [Nitrospira defluvii]|nr:VanZ family protein [Nitrospira defluvii]
MIVLTHSRTTSPTLWLLLWILYVCLIAASGIYHTNFVAHGHWEFLKWIPAAEEIWTFGFWLDIVVNLLLYVPFALLYLQRSATVTRSLVVRVMLLGLCLSCAVEFYQLYSHNRRAAPSDILCNVTGTWLGVVIRKKWWTG